MEKTAADAPVWYSAEEASAWANGFNEAIAERAKETPMKTFTFTINVEVEAVDLDQALQVAEEAKAFLVDPPKGFPWKIRNVEVDDVEEL